ncbi:hypothetical protein J5N97_013396 [Dioscorea zingiberensis]|uniref:Phosducin domain-containing protein n=1 Tax=Dioscorea zingiberensis TaxID=325984 RepID=A0A9D5CSW2_9LILI|nr:hypothetical protein J5N97_013396 [Dioscorea zingiberensis]
MADYHFVYKDVEGASTQWDDIQRRLGNLPPKPAPFKPAPFTPADDPDLQPKSKSWIDERSPDELEDLEDDPDLDDDRFLEEYRKKRLAEMREATRVVRFGSVVPISGSDFVREVSQAPADVWVVVLLYKDGIQECGILLGCLEELARSLIQFLLDGQSGGDTSREAVIDGVRKKFIEKVVKDREDDDDYSSD